MQEQKRADPEADEDALGQVAEDHQQEGREQHHRIAARGPQKRRELMLLGHVPGHDRQHARRAPPAGCSEASGAAISMNSSRNTECSMPATGPRAPERTLVAVRAMLPVTQKPPNSAEAMLATPCATSSQLER